MSVMRRSSSGESAISKHNITTVKVTFLCHVTVKTMYSAANKSNDCFGSGWRPKTELIDQLQSSRCLIYIHSLLLLLPPGPESPECRLKKGVKSEMRAETCLY